MKATELLRQRLVQIRAIPEITAQRAASQIEARLREDATTRRGNVPSYGERGDVPIHVEARAGEVRVNGPDWVLKKAQERDQVSDWQDLVVGEANKLIRGGE
jgi:hypothetical protein